MYPLWIVPGLTSGMVVAIIATFLITVLMGSLGRTRHGVIIAGRSAVSRTGNEDSLKARDTGWKWSRGCDGKM